MPTLLHDLDELVLLCRDDRARAYIADAVRCYKAGAIRSSIVSTWIAIAFDIIDKVRDLEVGGDKAAARLAESLRGAQESKDPTAALNFERKLLDKARDDLELISQTEYIDLERVQADRHRCAHPTLTAEAEVYEPPAELARTHIRAAVTHLLQYPPVQGKSAISTTGNPPALLGRQ